MKKIFISYTGNDVDWAEWIAWQLEEKGYQVILQSWDFRPGSNFPLQMQEALTDADLTIAVLSEDYMKSVFPQPEWAAAFVNDPTGKERKLIPVRVRPCKPDGLLASIVYIDLVGIEEKNAATTLMDGINSERAKPEKAPLFPGNNSSQFATTHESANKPIFPPNRICLYKLPTTGDKLFGRDEELKFLDEAWEIAELGSMDLHLCDYHLEATRVCEDQGRDEEAEEHRKIAAEMIERMGYFRHRAFLEEYKSRGNL